MVFEPYLDELPTQFAIAMAKFRCSNHRLPVEIGRYTNIPSHQRVCTKCERNTLGNEFQFSLVCQSLRNIRSRYIPSRIYRNPNVLQLEELMSNHKPTRSYLNVLSMQATRTLAALFTEWSRERPTLPGVQLCRHLACIPTPQHLSTNTRNGTWVYPIARHVS